MSRIAIFTDQDADAFIDTVAAGLVQAGTPFVVPVYPGEHIVHLVPRKDDFDEWKEEVRVRQGTQEVADVKFVPSNPRIGKVGTFLDVRDGNVYRTVRLNRKTWLGENMRFSVNGSQPPGGSESNVARYGRLYTRSEADLAIPQGWRLPTMDEWTGLVSLVGGSSAQKELRQGGSTKFDALLAGSHSFNIKNGAVVPGTHHLFDVRGFFWSTVATIGYCPGFGILADMNSMGATNITNGMAVIRREGVTYLRISLRLIRI